MRCRRAARRAKRCRRRSPFRPICRCSCRRSSRADDAWGLTPWDRGKCRDRIAAARNEGLYTPPSEQGTILFPFTGGGINWGGVAIDPATDIVYVNTSRLVHLITLFPAAEFEAMRKRFPGVEVSPQAGAPFGMKRELLLSPLKLPCNPPPWGVLAALDLRAKRILWETNLGTLEEIAPLGIALRTGTPNFGGPLVTRGGLVFIGATFDRYLRAFDARSGAELWTGRLPAAGSRDADDLRVAGAAIRGHRGRRTSRCGHRARRRHRRLRPAPARRIRSRPAIQIHRPPGRQVCSRSRNRRVVAGFCSVDGIRMAIAARASGG